MSFPGGNIYGTESVWMVTQGSYADYRVLAIFSNEDAAKVFVKEYHENKGIDPDDYCDGCSIEEMPFGEKSSDILGPFWVINDIVLEDGTLGRYSEIPYGPDEYGKAVQEYGPVAEGYRYYFEPAGSYKDQTKRAVLIRTVRRTEREVRSAHNIALNQVQRQVVDPLFRWEDNLS